MANQSFEEEVTITPVIRYVEKVFFAFLKLFWKVLCWLGETLTVFVQFTKHNFWKLLILSFLGGVTGFFSTLFFPRQYESSLTISLNLNSKDQLRNDVDHINNLMENNKVNELMDIFNINEIQAASLIHCQLKPATTKVEKYIALRELVGSEKEELEGFGKSSILAVNDEQLTSRYTILFKATNQEVFKQLEVGFMEYIGQSEEIQNDLFFEIKKLKNKKEVLLGEITNIEEVENFLKGTLLNPDQLEEDTAKIFMFENYLECMNKLNIISNQENKNGYKTEILEIDKKLNRLNQPYYIEGHLNPLGKKIGCGPSCRALKGTLLIFILALALLKFLSKKAEDES